MEGECMDVVPVSTAPVADMAVDPLTPKSESSFQTAISDAIDPPETAAGTGDEGPDETRPTKGPARGSDSRDLFYPHIRSNEETATADARSEKPVAPPVSALSDSGRTTAARSVRDDDLGGNDGCDLGTSGTSDIWAGSGDLDASNGGWGEATPGTGEKSGADTTSNWGDGFPSKSTNNNRVQAPTIRWGGGVAATTWNRGDMQTTGNEDRALSSNSILRDKGRPSPSKGKHVSWSAGWMPSEPSEERRSRPNGWRMDPERTSRLSQAPYILPPLGRTPLDKQANRSARRESTAPYSTSGRLREHSYSRSFDDHLDYGHPDDPGPTSRSSPSTNDIQFDLVSRFRIMDMSNIGKDILTHLRALTETWEQHLRAHRHLQEAAQTYQLRKRAYQDRINIEKDIERLTGIREELDQYKRTTIEQQKTREHLFKTTQELFSQKLEHFLMTIGGALTSKIQGAVAEVVRTIGGPTCDVGAIVEKCINLAAPHLLREHLQSQDRLVVLERKILQMTTDAKEKDLAITNLTARLQDLEARVAKESPTVEESTLGLIVVQPEAATSNLIH